MFELDPIFNLINPDNTVTVNRYLIHAIGLEETVLYGAMISKREYYAKSGELEDEWFHCPKAFLEEATGISMRRLAIIYKKLVDEGLLEIKKVGLPSKNYYRIVNDAFLVNRLLEKGRKISADKLAKAAGETTERTSEKGEKEPESPVFISSTKTCTTGDTQICTTSNTQTCTTSVATDLLIPVQTQEFSLDGLDSLLGVFGQVRDTINPDIRIAGFLPTWVENTVVSRSALVDLKYNYGEHLLNTRIKKSAEAGKSVKRRKAMCFYKNDLGPQYDYLAAELEG